MFIICHEISHCLTDEECKPFLEATYASNSKIEMQANVGAFYIMMCYYLQTSDITPEQFNLVSFQQACGIPTKYINQLAEYADSFLELGLTHHFL